MLIRTVSTTKAPAAIGPYSQAIAAGELLFCSGQLGIDPGTGQLAEGIKAQTEQALKNLSAILGAEGLSAERVVKTTVFLADIKDFSSMNEVYASFFVGQKPARSAIQVGALPKGGLVEIEAIACK